MGKQVDSGMQIKQEKTIGFHYNTKQYPEAGVKSEQEAQTMCIVAITWMAFLSIILYISVPGMVRYHTTSPKAAMW